MNKYKWVILGWTLFITSIPGCLQERAETPTKGMLTAVVSESVSPLLKQEKEKFEGLYPDAHVELLTATDREAVTRFFNDTIKVIILSRPLNQEEREVSKRFNLEFQEHKIAIDGVAFLVNDRNPIERLRIGQLDSIYRGIVRDWDDVGGKPFPIEICLPDANAGDFEIVGLKILKGQKYLNPNKVVSTSEEMLKFVSDRPNAIGMVGLNWLSQKNENVRVLQLSDPNAPDSLGIRDKHFAPFQAHVYRGYYPVTRDVFIYSRADMYGVGAGFVSFITSAPGQQIILYNGLVPATMPIRLVELTNQGVQP